MDTSILDDLGFIYDEEDNLWYDKKNEFRVGVNETYRHPYFDLYYGGYTTKVGEYYTGLELIKGIVEYVDHKKYIEKFGKLLN